MNIAIIFAGGVGTRMNTKDKPKQFLMVHGKPIIVHTCIRPLSAAIRAAFSGQTGPY